MNRKAKERVAIAKDALKWVKAGALVPTSRLYILPENDDAAFAIKARGKTQLRDIKLGKCKVCAIGGLFLAKAVRFDKVSVKDYCAYNYWSTLQEHFDLDQLDLIEDAFEDALKNKYPDDSERMMRILQNIIDNNGTFEQDQLK